MDPLPPEHSEPEIDALLRSRRPRPDAVWRAATERRLIPSRRRWGVVQQPRAAWGLGAAAAVALAVLVLTLSLAGVGPLAGDDRGVKAEDRCRTVTVTRTERVPFVAPGADGQDVIRYRRERVRRTERRCD